MATFISNIKKRFSIKPTSDVVSNNNNKIDILENDDANEIKQLNNNNNNNNNNSNNNNQLKNVYKRKKSVTEDSSDDSSSNNSEDEEDSDDNSGQENDKIVNNKKTVSFKEQPKPILNKQLSAVPKSKRKSIIIPPTLNNSNTDATTARDTGKTIVNQPLPPMKSTLTHLQISEIYANCIKLSTENKINQKNSWTLKLIDHFDDVLENQHSGNTNTTNFQAASCVLDASVKIYSNRVDSVHVDTYKILGGLSRAERDENNRNEDDDENEDENGENNKNDENSNNKNKKKRKKSGVNTLEQNIDNITIKKFDLQFMVDPLFGKTSAAFDEGGAKGLLLNNLSIYGDCKLVFDSNDAIYSTNSDNPSPTPKSLNSKVNISHWKHLFTPGSNNKLEICPTYHGFSDWSVKSQAGLSFNIDSLLKKNQSKSDDEKEENQQNNNIEDNFLNMDGGGSLNNSNDDIQQSNQQQQQQQDEIDLNKLGNNGFDDGDMGPNFGGDDDFGGEGIGLAYDDDEEHDENRNNDNNNIMGILDANQDWDQLNLVEPSQNQNWTGPEHWKFSKKKVINKKQVSEDGEDIIGEAEEGDKAKKKRKTPKKKAFLLDFDSAPPPESMFEPGRGSTLTTASLKKASESSTILPPDIHYDIKMLSRLFNKPKCSIPPMSKRDQVLKFLRPKGAGGNNGENGENDDEDDEDNGNQDYDFPNSQILQDDFNPNANPKGGDDDYGDFGGGMAWDDGDGYRPNENGENQENNNNNNGNVNNENSNTQTPFTIGLNGGVLIQEPRKVNKIDINYARVSKKIDVKQLKTSVWSILESENESIGGKKQEEQEEATINEHSFGSLIDNLKEEQNQLRANNKPTAGEISIPLAFICVLHLANEKNLTLNQENINNFFISK